MLFDLDDLVGNEEIARHLGVRTSAVSNWRKRHPEMPQPVKWLVRGPLYSLSEVSAWYHLKWPDRFEHGHNYGR